MVHAVHMLDQLQHLVGVTDLVVVPGHDLHKGVGQGDAGVGVKDGGAGIAQEVRSEERRVGKECRSRWSPYH